MQQSDRSTKRGSKSLQSLVRAEKLTQIAFILPVSVVVGWLLGAALDKWLHTHWIYLAGLLLGVASGLVQVFRMVSAPSTLSNTASDPTAPPGKGFADQPTENAQGKWDKWD